MTWNDARPGSKNRFRKSDDVWTLPSADACRIRRPAPPQTAAGTVSRTGLASVLASAAEMAQAAAATVAVACEMGPLDAQGDPPGDYSALDVVAPAGAPVGSGR